jgi:hypothetical protein
MAQTALTRSNARIDALRDTRADLLAMDESRKRFAAMISGLHIHYDLGEAPAARPPHARSRPVTADGPLRVFTLLHQAQPCCSTSAQSGASIGALLCHVRDRAQRGAGTRPHVGRPVDSRLTEPGAW